MLVMADHENASLESCQTLHNRSSCLRLDVTKNVIALTQKPTRPQMYMVVSIPDFHSCTSRCITPVSRLFCPSRICPVQLLCVHVGVMIETHNAGSQKL